MTALDLQSWLSLVSTIAIVVALVFAGFQVQEANRARREQAAVVMIQSTQDDSFTRAMNEVAQLPADLSAEQVDASGVVLMFWSRAKGWVARERQRSGNPKLLEWCEWLADRVGERRASLGHEPAHLKHSGWR